MKNGSIILFLFILPAIVFAQENNSLTCSDGIDNDNDGFIDCEDTDCQQLPNQGCQTCMFDGFSFADTVIEYLPNCLLDLSPTDTTPIAAVGVSDYLNDYDGSYVALGTGGIIKLGFTNNVVVNSGDTEPDIWVFEIGGLVEGSSIELKPCDSITKSILINEGIGDIDGDGYFDFGGIGGATAFLEIDGFLSGSYNYGELKFRAIKITDIGNTPCTISAGADIDAVCAISSQIADCACTPNGTEIIDDCGECLEPSDPSFNQSCVDCASTPNGTAVIDECGECLEPSDPTFNQSCIDCTANINGTAEIDSCGVCLEPNDSEFNQSCAEESEVYYPNAFSPNDDGINDHFTLFAKPNSITIESLRIFDRWGANVFNNFNFEPNIPSFGWDGTHKGEEMNPAVFAFFAEIIFANGRRKIIKGDVQLIR